VSEPLSRALEDGPPIMAPQPGDPGTRTVEVFTAANRRVGCAAVPIDSDPSVILMGPRAFVRNWKGGAYIEREAARVQVHV